MEYEMEVETKVDMRVEKKKTGLGSYREGEREVCQNGASSGK